MINIKEQVFGLSDGTLSGLARDMGVENSTLYSVIESFREKFITFCEENHWDFSNWVEAYQKYSSVTSQQ